MDMGDGKAVMGYWSKRLISKHDNREDACFGVIWAPPAQDVYGRPLFFSAVFFVQAHQLDDLLKAISDSPNILPYAILPTAETDKIPPFLRNEAWDQEQREYLDAFKKLYVTSVLGPSPVTVGAPFEIGREQEVVEPPKPTHDVCDRPTVMQAIARKLRKYVR